MSERTITTIPATINRFTAAPLTEVRKRRVAGYARVSTDHEDQVTGYEAQVDYYTNYIQDREDWEFVEVYTDVGISATSTAKRDGFNRMVADKIDLIVTKSVSRFAWNTVDSLSTIRKLKEKGVEVYFEKENIWTFDSKGELLITIMSSLAHKESRSISENCTWGQRKRFSDGKVCVPYSRFLGYDRSDDKDGGLVINEEQAVIARRQSGENRHSGVSIFSSKLKCGCCGGWYGSKVRHSTSKYRRVIRQCNHKFKNDEKCETPHLTEESIKPAFVSAVNKLLTDKGEIVANFRVIQVALFDTTALDAEVKRLRSELAVVTELIHKCIGENARVALDQSEYQERYDGLVTRYDTAKARFNEVTKHITDKTARSKAMEVFIAELAKQDGLITEFDERLGCNPVDFVTVHNEKDIRFTFKNGVNIEA